MTISNTGTENLESRVRVKLTDPLGHGIAGLKYQFKHGDKIVAKGTTDANGNITPFVSKIGTLLSLFVEHFISNEMKKIKTVIPWSNDFSIKLASDKVKHELSLVKDEGVPGNYQRKTYPIAEGDTLGRIAVRNGTTAEAIAALNGMKLTDILHIGRILKLPINKSAAASSPAPPPASVAEPAKSPVPATAHSEKSSPIASTVPSSNVSNADSQPHSAPNIAAPSPAPVSMPPTQSSAANTSKFSEQKSTPAPAQTPVPADTVPIKKVEDRGANGTPKSTANLVCDQSGCVKVGDTGPLIEEINIRLSGFGGTILFQEKNTPKAQKKKLNEFTTQTEHAVKQFQRDYMGVEETGKVCGAVLSALDAFAKKYPLPIASMKCGCGKCGGFGNGYHDSAKAEFWKEKDTPYLGTEFPGMHRCLLWSFRAALYYIAEKDKDLDYHFFRISSSYRCWNDNKLQTKLQNEKIALENKKLTEKEKKPNPPPRTTTNHMGNALDVQFKHGKETDVCTGNTLQNLRDKIFKARLNGQMGWESHNKISMESNGQGAKRWVHFDVREYENEYKQDRYYATTQAGADGEPLVDIAKRENRLKLINCGGIPRKTPPPATDRLPVSSLELSPKGLKFIMDFEKFRDKLYDDSRSYCTIGWGHLLEEKSCATLKSEKNKKYKKYENGITPEDALALFKSDVNNISDLARKSMHVPLYQHEYDALISLAFNLGSYDCCPKLIAKLNTKDYNGCCDEFSDIVNKGTSSEEGLQKRRNAEIKMFRSNVYDSTH